MSTLKVGTIQDHANSTTAMTIDGSGRILTPARPSFRAKLSGSATTVSANNDIVFDDVTTATHGCHNIGGHYNTSNGIFTAPIAGVYFFSFSVYRNNTADAEVNMFLGNQAVGVAREKSDGASYDTMNLTTTLNLSASNEVKIRCIDGTIYIDTNVHSFSGFLIG
tara:strand:+ start:243 stop:737 length:495 start_codon:yes stop_codon:yes gene_type:complete